MHPHVIVAAGRAAHHAVGLVSKRLDHQHGQAIAKIQADVQRLMITEVTGAAVAAIRDGSRFILTLCDKQSDHFMRQQNKFADALVGQTDAVDRVRIDYLHKKAGEDIAATRRDAMAFHAVMSELLVQAVTELSRETPGFTMDVSLQPPASLLERGIDILDD